MGHACAASLIIMMMHSLGVTMVTGKKLRVAALALLAGISATWAAQSSAAPQTVEVVVNANGFPFSFIDDNNKLSGYDGELLQIVDERLPDYQFHFSAVSRDAMIVGLSTGAYSLAADHFYLTKERAAQYDYSHQPSGISDLRLIVRNDENGIHNLDDLANGNKKLVPIHTNDARYTVIENYNQKHTAKPINLQPNGEQSAADIFRSVASGEYDAAIYPIGALLALNKSLNLNLKASDSVGLFPNVFLYRKNTDPKLIKAVDNVLVALKNDGTLSALSKKWYNEDVYQLPGASAVKVNTDWE